MSQHHPAPFSALPTPPAAIPALPISVFAPVPPPPVRVTPGSSIPLFTSQRNTLQRINNAQLESNMPIADVPVRLDRYVPVPAVDDDNNLGSQIKPLPSAEYAAQSSAAIRDGRAARLAAFQQDVKRRVNKQANQRKHEQQARLQAMEHRLQPVLGGALALTAPNGELSSSGSGSGSGVRRRTALEMNIESIEASIRAARTSLASFSLAEPTKPTKPTSSPFVASSSSLSATQFSIPSSSSSSSSSLSSSMSSSLASVPTLSFGRMSSSSSARDRSDENKYGDRTDYGSPSSSAASPSARPSTAIDHRRPDPSAYPPAPPLTEDEEWATREGPFWSRGLPPSSDNLHASRKPDRAVSLMVRRAESERNRAEVQLRTRPPPPPPSSSSPSIVPLSSSSSSSSSVRRPTSSPSSDPSGPLNESSLTNKPTNSGSGSGSARPGSASARSGSSTARSTSSRGGSKETAAVDREVLVERHYAESTSPRPSGATPAQPPSASLSKPKAPAPSAIRRSLVERASEHSRTAGIHDPHMPALCTCVTGARGVVDRHHNNCIFYGRDQAYNRAMASALVALDQRA